MNEGRRGAELLLQQRAAAEGQRRITETEQNVQILNQRMEVAESQPWQIIRAEMMRMVDDFEQTLHRSASCTEEMWQARAASNALVEVIQKYDGAKAARMRLQQQVQDTASEAGIGPARAD